MQDKRGFTLVELIVVLILIAILAAIAVPRFIDAGSNARQNASSSIAASLATVSASNYARRSANSSTGSPINNCTQVGPLLASGLPVGYSIASLAISAGTSANCTVTGPGSTSATFVAWGIA